MEFVFNKTVCKNLRKSLRKEWLETNGLGSYASSSLVCCNTRKYHGLLVVKSNEPAGRFVLLSGVEDSLLIGGAEAALSCRKHPDVYYPCGHDFVHEVTLGNIPTFVYRFGDVYIKREIMMLDKQDVTLMRYSLECDNAKDFCEQVGAARLRIKPLLAYRNMHALASANIDFQVKTWPEKNGFSIRPYNSLPPLFMQADFPFVFRPSPDWYYNVEYMIESSRGFANHEDLFQPGVMDIDLRPGQSVVISASTEDVVTNLGALNDLWQAEEKRRAERIALTEKQNPLMAHLQKEGQRFLVQNKDQGDEKSIVAGYHWFDAWGRDTCISLAGLTFLSGQDEFGWQVLNRLAKEARDGQIPNVFSADGKHSYNCADASLWFSFASQTAFTSSEDAPKRFREHCWPFLKSVIQNYASGNVPYVNCDAQGFLHVGTKHTQLTWMDAMVNGQAVTPRYGCPVEINALWYNLLAFARQLAKHYGENHPHELCHQRSLDKMRKIFKERFWVEQEHSCYLADCWRPGEVDASLRPNQLFAVGLPYPILEEEYWGDVVESCRNALLTPYGMRTLAPSDYRYHSLYKGSPEERDGAYHQGTVWPWPLGIYADALLRGATDVPSAVHGFLEEIHPLLTSHLVEAGVGTLSEIFMADPPYLPDGCMAQAWSVAEVIRLFTVLRQVAPEVVEEWEEKFTTPDMDITF